MIQIAYLLVLVICLSFAVGSFLLAHDMQKRLSPAFLVSYFYYVLCYLIFGLYSIAGHSFFQYLFGVLDVSSGTENALTAFMMFFGAPFLITAWIMILKTGIEMSGKIIRSWVVWAYFILSIIILLITGLIILYQGSNLYTDYGIESGGVTVYIMLDAMSHITFFVFVLLSLKSSSMPGDAVVWRKAFGSLIFFGMFLRTVSLLIEDIIFVHPLIYLLVFFAGIFVPVLYLRWITSRTTFVEFAGKKSEETMSRFYSKHNISKREVEVIVKICEGKSNQEIADALFISLQTVKDHTHRIYQKTGVNTRMQLAKMVSTHSVSL